MTSISSLVVASALVGGLAACKPTCATTAPSAPQLRLEDPSAPGSDFFAHPWPSDARRDARGRLELRGFPNPTQSTTLEDYVRVIGEETSAFSTSAPAYLTFSAPLDPGSLPADARATLEPSATVQLVRLDVPGERVPVDLRTSNAATLYLPEDHLIVAPPPGITLAPGAPYAVLGLRGMRSEDGRELEAPTTLARAIDEACVEDVPARIAAAFAPLRAFLARPGAPPADDVVAATVFTTQDAVAEIRALARAAREAPLQLGPLTLESLAQVEVRDDVVLVAGEVSLPSFQAGRPPYAGLGDGGALARGDDGAPRVDHRERTRVGLSIPRRAPGREPGPSGWPVVLYAHGTGGSYASTFDARIADVLGRRGLAVVGFDQTLHGPRDPSGSDPDVTFFNLFNPVAARDNVRQGTADLVSMTELLSSGLMLPAEIALEETRLDGHALAFLGHSQGSIVGAPFVAVEPRVEAFVFSGLGAILTITLLERKDPLDFRGLFSTLLALPETEPLERLHPVLALLQTFIEPADPISYARSLLRDPPDGARRDLLQLEGLLDFAAPATGQEAFAVAAGIPVIEPVARLPASAPLVGLDVATAPVFDNVAAGRGTFGLVQYPDETHFPLFRNVDARARFSEFLESAVREGRARIAAPAP